MIIRRPNSCQYYQVHGLKGGSRKTWAKSTNAADFWPKEWLPAEPGFKNVRIHSYGYNSDWSERRGNVLNVHDFGNGLLADLSNCPQLRRNEVSSTCFRSSFEIFVDS